MKKKPPKQSKTPDSNPAPPWNTGDIDPKLFAQVLKEQQAKEAKEAPGFPVIWPETDS